MCDAFLCRLAIIFILDFYLGLVFAVPLCIYFVSVSVSLLHCTV